MPTIFPGDGKELGSVYALAVTYFFVATCGAMTSLAISLHFASRESGETLVAAVLISGACAQVFLSPLLTPFFDRISPLTVAQTAAFIECVALVLLFLFPEPAFLIAGNVVVATLSGLSIPAYCVIAEECAPSHNQARVFSFLDTARLSGSFVGPALGGLLLDFGTLSTALAYEAAAVAGSFLVLCILDFRLRKNSAQINSVNTGRKPLKIFRSILEAPTLLLTQPHTRQALTSIWAAIIFTSIYNVALVFYATETLQASGLIYAIVAQCFIVGRIFGARMSTRLTEANALPTLIKAGAAMGLCIAIPGFVPSLLVCIPFFALAGVCNALQVAALRMVIVHSVRPAIKPKALSTMGTVNNSAMLVGYIVGAPVVASIGPSLALVVAGLGTMLFTVLPPTWRALRIATRGKTVTSSP
ncbi:major facilitator superfamily protein [Corynebacterium ulcerans]|uniref:Major facilitator superfamily protein n=1 Tax=Corynebacterium ulcerans TaxID=65058 RepID=A0ABD7MUL3_CORUL|nr:major facilitator superfamily protein [Corynebacterium ulcerans]